MLRIPLLIKNSTRYNYNDVTNHIWLINENLTQMMATGQKTIAFNEQITFVTLTSSNNQAAKKIQLLINYEFETKKDIFSVLSKILIKPKDTLTFRIDKPRSLNYEEYDTLRTRLHNNSFYIRAFDYKCSLISWLCRIVHLDIFDKTEATNVVQKQKLVIEYANGVFRKEKERVMALLQNQDGPEEYTMNDWLARIELCMFCIVHDFRKNFRKKINCIKDLIESKCLEKYQSYIERFKKGKICTITAVLPADATELSMEDLQLDARYILSKASRLSLLLMIYNIKSEENKINLLQQLITDHYADIVYDFTK